MAVCLNSPAMTREFAPDRLDVPGFAEAAGTLSAHDPLSRFPRLVAEATGEVLQSSVDWRAVGAQRAGAAGGPEPWMHLEADAVVPLQCQRCLSPVDTALRVDRWFRFAVDEATAAAQDEEAEEDVLVSSQAFELRALIEDELLMDIPITPRHDVCPDAPPLSAVDAGFETAEAERPHPFAALDGLLGRKPG